MRGCNQEALAEIKRHMSAAAAKESADASVDTETGKTGIIDQIESQIKQFRCIVNCFSFRRSFYMSVMLLNNLQISFRIRMFLYTKAKARAILSIHTVQCF